MVEEGERGWMRRKKRGKENKRSVNRVEYRRRERIWRSKKHKGT